LILLVRGFSLRRSGLCSVACHLRSYDALYRLTPLRIYGKDRAKGTTKVYTRSVPQVSVFHVEVGIPNKKGGPLRSRRLELMLSLPVDFDFYTWSAMFVMKVSRRGLLSRAQSGAQSLNSAAPRTGSLSRKSTSTSSCRCLHRASHRWRYNRQSWRDTRIVVRNL
jgi:hypothetical protein